MLARRRRRTSRVAGDAGAAGRKGEAARAGDTGVAGVGLVNWMSGDRGASSGDAGPAPGVGGETPSPPFYGARSSKTVTGGVSWLCRRRHSLLKGDPNPSVEIGEAVQVVHDRRKVFVLVQIQRRKERVLLEAQRGARRQVVAYVFLGYYSEIN